MIALIPLTKAF